MLCHLGGLLVGPRAARCFEWWGVHGAAGMASLVVQCPDCGGLDIRCKDIRFCVRNLAYVILLCKRLQLCINE